MSILFLPGTLLVNTDLQLLEGALHPTMTGIESKGERVDVICCRNVCSNHTAKPLHVLQFLAWQRHGN
eukprot:m.555400 g.555400  ORF g.555400 m.555400 type:complete len:68 (-) comp22181_c0_seq32:2381-2584(-)